MIQSQQLLLLSHVGPSASEQMNQKPGMRIASKQILVSGKKSFDSFLVVKPIFYNDIKQFQPKMGIYEPHHAKTCLCHM